MFWSLQENALEQDDLDSLVSFIKGGNRLTQGKKVKEFEQKFAEWQGCKFCVFVNSGSSANFLLLNTLKEQLKWQNNDEVIVPAVTWSTTIAPVIQNGLKPVFVDINLNDLSFNYDLLKKCITFKTKAIFITHLLGFPADIPQIIKTFNIHIVEDCCEAQGANIRGKKVGNWGIGSSFSFYWAHQMTTIEGGMVCTNYQDIYEKLIMKRSHGLARELPQGCDYLKAHYPKTVPEFLFLTDGFNVRSTELNAVLGLSQLNKIDRIIAIRNDNYTRFAKICKQYKELITLESEGISSFSFPFLFRDEALKQQFQEVLTKEGIESRPIVGGNLLRQPFLKNYNDPFQFKNAEFIHKNAFYIGNNQFVDTGKLDKLEILLETFFGQ